MSLKKLARNLMTRGFRGNKASPVRNNAPKLQMLQLEDRITPALYVDNPADFSITNDQGTIGLLDNGDTVTWNSAVTDHPAGMVTGLIYGTDAFGTIQSSINAATAGDTINIATGTYISPSQITIDRTVTLTGAGADATILKQSGQATGTEVRTVQIQAPNVTLEHLTLGGWVDTPSVANLGNGYLAWTIADGTTFDNVHFDANDNRVGIYLGTQNDFTVTNSQFTGTLFRTGIRGAGERMNISHNSFETSHYWYSPIYFEYGAPTSGTISYNYFANRVGVSNTALGDFKEDGTGLYAITNFQPNKTTSDGLYIVYNTFDFVDSNLVNSSGNSPVPVAVYIDPLLSPSGPIVVQDNIFQGYQYTGAPATSTPLWRPTSGVFGGALEFDGVDDFGVFQSALFDVGARGTLNFWVNSSDLSKRNQFFEGPGDAGFEVQYRTNSSGQVYARSTTVGGDFVIRSGSDSSLLLNTWANIQVVWDFNGIPGDTTAKLRLYINGVESTYLSGFTPTDLNWSSIVSTVNQLMNVGRDPGDSTRYFKGLMDDIGWFNQALNTTDRNLIRTTGVSALASDSRLVAHWDFDQSSGTSAIDNKNGIVMYVSADGSLPADLFGPQFLPTGGAFGGALQFDGFDDYATFDFGANELGDKGTVNLWVYMEDVIRRNQIFEGPGNGGMELQFRTNSGGQLYSRSPGDPNDYVIRTGSDGALFLNNWRNVQIIWDFNGLPPADGGGKLRIFVDGVESGYLSGLTPTDLNWPSIVTTINGIISLGRDLGDATRYFKGRMDDIAWFDDVLNSTDRNSLRTLSGSTFAGDPRMIAYWNLDDPIGTTIVSGNGGTTIDLNLQAPPPPAPKTAYAIFASPTVLVDNNVFWNNDVNFNAPVTVGPNGNIVGDPLFQGTGATTDAIYALHFNSSALNLGTGYPTVGQRHIGAYQGLPVGIPTVVYVEDVDWNAYNYGDLILDADFGTTGAQPAYFGLNAFSTIAAAQVAVEVGGTIIVNGGSYIATTLMNTQNLIVTGANATQSVTFAGLTTASGQNVTIQGASVLTVGDATNTTAAGLITGSGSLVKQGTGTLTLSGTNTYAGTTTVNAGTLLVNGANNGTGAVTVNNSAILGGTGSIAGVVNVATGATVNPGVATGVLSTGSITFLSGANFTVEIDTTTVGTGYDQLNVTGAVNLGGATLSTSGTLSVTPGTLQSIVIINNDGSDAVVGQFAGLTEGSAISFGGSQLFISYQGGDGNDVVLYSQPIVNGTAAGDVLIFNATATGYTYQLNSDPVIAVTSGATNFTFNGLGGDDRMIVNLNTFALPVDGVFFNGGTQDSPITSGTNLVFGDVLTINGDASHTATYLPDGVASALDNDGAVSVAGQGVINFTQLEPVDFIGLGVVNLNYANGDDVISIANGKDAGTNALDALIVSGTSGGVAFEQAHLRNIGTVNLNTSTTDGNDSITISSASNAHGITDFNIVTGAGADTVTVNGNAMFAGDVNIASQNIAFNGGTLSAGTTKSVTLNAGLGAISTNGPGVDVIAQDLFATATTGINLDTTVVTITASNTGAGNIVIDETDAVTLTSLTAANGNISISNATADMTVVTVTASGSASLTATAGNIVDDGSNATRVSAGTSATFTANTGAIGGAGAMGQIDTAAASITATSANGIWIGELDTVAITNATTTNGIIEIVSGGTMTATNVVAGGASDLRLTTTAGDIVVSVVDAAGDSVLLQAAGAITDGNGAANNITATNLNAVAGTGIGTAGNAIETSITNLAASGGTGGVFVTNTGDLTITNLTTFTVPTSGVTATGDITIATTGNLTVSKAVTSSGAVTLSFGQANAGNTALVNATIDGTSATILGGTGDDTITVNTTGTTDLLLNGQDGSDDYIVNFGTLGAGDVVIADSGVATDIDQAFLTGTTSADTFEVNTTVSGTNAVTRGSERVTYLASNLEEMQISAGAGADIFNVQFAASKLPGVFRILGEADSDTANLYGTTAADTFTVINDTVSFGSTGEVVRYDNALEKLNVNGPSFAGDPTPTAPTLTDAGDTFIVTPDVQTAITIRGGNPVNGFGDTLNLNVLGATTGINLSNAKVPTGSITWGAAQRATVDWTSIETFPIPLGLGGSFDFNSGTSPTQQGFYGVLSSDTPSSGSLAYAQVGWTTPTFSFDRPTDAPASGPLGDLLRDGAYNWWTPTNARTFQVKVANGQPVQITAVIGDTYTGRDFIRMEVSSDGGVTWVSLPGSTNDTFTMRNLGYDFVSFTSTLYTPTSETLLVKIYDDATNGGDTFWVLNSLEVRPQEMVFPLTFARPSFNTLTDMLIADGTTIDTYTGTGAAPNAVLTVTVSNGANAGIDVLPQMKEFQIQADALGAYSFQVLRPTGTANTISLRDVTGNSFGTINVTYVLPTVRSVDFGTATSPVQVLTPAQIESTTTPKYVGFGAQAYTGTAGNAMGWVNSPGLNTFDRSSIAATTGDLLRDGVYGNQANAGVFRMDLAAAVGTSYTITVTLGDLFQARDQMFVDVVDAGGALISTVVSNALTPLNQATSFTFTAMTDATGSIFLRFRDAGGDQVWGLSSIEARPTVSTFTITPNSGTVPADGTTMTTYTITGATANTLITLSTTQGVITTSDGNVTYTSLQVLTDNAGNATFTIVSPQSSNAITGTIVASEVTGAKSASITQAYTAAASNQPAVAKYDFNGGSIDTALNRTSVRGNTVFSTSLGYGWLSSVYEFERTAASTPIDPSLYRDGAWGYGFSGTFRATVAPSSSSTVRVYVGDSYGNWGGIVVSAEGGATANPNTTAAPFGFVDVIGTDTNNDGFLNITIGNLPGYSVWVVNGIDITPNSSNLPTPPALTVMGPGAPTAAGSTSTFSISGATPSSLVTVTASKGTLIGTDASSSIAGFQVMTDFSGTAIVMVQAPQSFGAATDTISANDVINGATGQTMQNYTGATAQRFDFNGSSVNTAAGFASVRGSDLFSTTTGYGWVSGTYEFERASAAASNGALYRDGAWGYGFSSTFRVAVTMGGSYAARVYVGDSYANWPGITISAEGGTTANPDTTATPFGYVTVSGTDTNNDGFFDVTIGNLPSFSIWVANGIDIATSIATLPAMPLTLKIAPTVFAPSISSATPLSQTDLNSLAVEAVNRWIATGISAEQVASLRSVQFEVGDLLSTGRLGEQRPGTITIDATAGGLGWFIDSTPSDDAEYTSSNGRLVATSGAALSGIDLLTVLMHELGHQLGYADLDTDMANGSIMSDLFSTAERRLPTSSSHTSDTAVSVVPSVTAVSVTAPVAAVTATPTAPVITISKPIATPSTTTNLNVAALRGGEEIVDLQLAPSPAPIKSALEDDFAFWGVPLTTEAKPMLKNDDLNISITSLSTSDVSIAWPMWNDDDTK